MTQFVEMNFRDFKAIFNSLCQVYSVHADIDMNGQSWAAGKEKKHIFNIPETAIVTFPKLIKSKTQWYYSV